MMDDAVDDAVDNAVLCGGQHGCKEVEGDQSPGALEFARDIEVVSAGCG